MQSITKASRQDQNRWFACVLVSTLVLLINTGTLNAQKSSAPDAPLIQGHDLCAAGDVEAGRAEYARLAADTNAPVALRSLAQITLAQSWRREKNWRAAEKAYAQVLALPGAPAHHRAEAAAQIGELTRIKAGQPARDPSATRTALPRRRAPGTELHVSPHGSDTNPGTKGQPFATL